MVAVPVGYAFHDGHALRSASKWGNSTTLSSRATSEHLNVEIRNCGIKAISSQSCQGNRRRLSLAYINPQHIVSTIKTSEREFLPLLGLVNHNLWNFILRSLGGVLRRTKLPKNRSPDACAS